MAPTLASERSAIAPMGGTLSREPREIYWQKDSTTTQVLTQVFSTQPQHPGCEEPKMASMLLCTEQLTDSSLKIHEKGLEDNFLGKLFPVLAWWPEFESQHTHENPGLQL